LVSHVGFSNGIAELTLKKPPPLVLPSSLIASCEATGPCTRVCSSPVSVCRWVGALRLWSTPWEARNRPPSTDRGRRMYSSTRVTST
jgi:hypothetical protein